MIVVDKVTKYYGSHCAVRELDFKIAEGECIGFLGLNGAGKTTTLRLLSCLLLPTSGRVTIRGHDVEESPHEIRKFIGYLPESPPLYGEMTVREYLHFAAQLRGMATREARDRVPEVLKIANVDSVADVAIASLSHGYRQRVGIAQAIVHRPALLILDEPIQGLDPVQIVEMREMIRSLRGKHTILLSSHIISEIEQTCDRILMMHDGRIAAEGTEDQIAERLAGSPAAAAAQEIARRTTTAALLELEVEATEQALRDALSSVPGAGTLQLVGVRDARGVLRARLETRGEIRASVSRAIVQAGLGLLGIRRATSGLESLFVELSKREGEGHSGNGVGDGGGRAADGNGKPAGDRTKEDA